MIAYLVKKTIIYIKILNKKTQFSWAESLDFCHGVGLELAAIESQAENDLVFTYLQNLPHPCKIQYFLIILLQFEFEFGIIWQYFEFRLKLYVPV